MLPNTGNFACSSCRFPGSEDKEFYDISREDFLLFFKSWICQFCVYNSHKTHKSAQGKYLVGPEKKQEKHRKVENAILVDTLPRAEN